jgi:chemotaxis methyl-accepting protein methylase
MDKENVVTGPTLTRTFNAVTLNDVEKTGTTANEILKIGVTAFDILSIGCSVGEFSYKIAVHHYNTQVKMYE